LIMLAFVPSACGVRANRRVAPVVAWFVALSAAAGIAREAVSADSDSGAGAASVTPSVRIVDCDSNGMSRLEIEAGES
jgi:hypothetical protein